jgi:hypothetical protein
MRVYLCVLRAHVCVCMFACMYHPHRHQPPRISMEASPEGVGVERLRFGFGVWGLGFGFHVLNQG